MARKVLKAKLSRNSLQELRKQIDAYRKDLPHKVARALEILAEKGVNKAEQVSNSSSVFGGAVVFEKQLADVSEYEVSAIMRATDLGIDVSWQQKDGVKTERVNALLMLEFGSGRYADDEHRGTFPDATHSFDPNGWYFKPVGSDEWVHSLGYKPKRPMLEAYEEMEREVRNAFEEAFR